MLFNESGGVRDSALLQCCLLVLYLGLDGVVPLLGSCCCGAAAHVQGLFFDCRIGENLRWERKNAHVAF